MQQVAETQQVTETQQVAETLRKASQEGRPAAVGRVIGLKGFSTLALDDLVAVDSTGALHGEMLGRAGREALGPAGAELLAGPARLATVTISVHGPAVTELGLSCGGQADVLLQPADQVPTQVWERLAGRAPVALVTVVEGAGSGARAVGVGPGGETWGTLTGGLPAPDVLVEEARALLRQGRSAFKQVETGTGGTALVEAWVPAPRLVVVGSGDVVAALEAQAGLLGWEVRATEAVGDVGGLLDWAGATAALIVLTHDPHVDSPALAAGLERSVAYIGAMGSRGTQSRRTERLAAQGITAEQLAQVHKPIGLNLGGRRAPEVALSIVAEILASHHGRDAGHLRDTGGPIHG